MSNPAIVRLFTGIENPVVAQSLERALRSKLPLRIAVLPPSTFPAVVLLAKLAKEWNEAPIVDDYGMLMDLVKFEFTKTPPGFWHPDSFLVSAIQQYGDETSLADNQAADYIANAYRDLTGAFASTDVLPTRPKKGRR